MHSCYFYGVIGFVGKFANDVYSDNVSRFSIRKATHADAEGIAHVHVQSWAETYSNLMPAEFFAKSTRYLCDFGSRPQRQ